MTEYEFRLALLLADGWLIESAGSTSHELRKSRRYIRLAVDGDTVTAHDITTVAAHPLALDPWSLEPLDCDDPADDPQPIDHQPGTPLDLKAQP